MLTYRTLTNNKAKLAAPYLLAISLQSYGTDGRLELLRGQDGYSVEMAVVSLRPRLAFHFIAC